MKKMMAHRDQRAESVQGNGSDATMAKDYVKSMNADIARFERALKVLRELSSKS